MRHLEHSSKVSKVTREREMIGLNYARRALSFIVASVFLVMFIVFTHKLECTKLKTLSLEFSCVVIDKATCVSCVSILQLFSFILLETIESKPSPTNHEKHSKLINT